MTNGKYKGYCAFAAVDCDEKLVSVSLPVDVHPLEHYNNTLRYVPGLVSAAYAPTSELAEKLLDQQIEAGERK